MSKVSDMVKMYSQQNQVSGPKPSSVGRKWPPVNTSGGSPGQKPALPNTPKPAINESRPNFAPKPSALYPGRSNNSPRHAGDTKEHNNIPSWQRNQTDREDKLPPWKARQQEKNDTNPPWKRGSPEKNEVPSWKARQQEQEKINDNPPWKGAQERTEFPSWKPRQEQEKTDNIPPWKVASSEKNEVPSWKARRSEPEKKDNVSPWKAAMQERNEIPPWKARQQDKENNNSPPWKAKQQEQEKKTDSPSWSGRQHGQEKKEELSPWKARQQEQGRKNSWGSRPNQPSPVSNSNKDLPPPPLPGTKPYFKPPSVDASPLPEEEDNMYLESQSPAHYPPPVTYSPSQKTNASKSSIANEDSAGRRNRNQSFLHAPASPMLHVKPSSPKLPHENSLPPPPPLSDKPPKVNGVPPRLKIPPEKYSERPPLKQSKPPNVVLPTKGKKKFNIPPLLRPKSPMRNLPPPPSVEDMPLPLPPRDSEPPPIPPMTRSLPAPPPKDGPAIRNLPAPPTMDGPPSLPARRPLPSPTPDKKSMPLPAVPSIGEDIYEDTNEPPALPPMRQPVPPPVQEVEEMIPTYESDEEEGAAIYDETPDDIPPPSAMSGYSPAGFSAEPQEIEEDMYEDVEEYMRLKKLRQQPPPVVNEGSKKDKKKNSSDKREKDIRKKFKLSEGEISILGKGRVKESMKAGRGGKGLSVSVNEWIDVIRMTDNPKGKWLVRNEGGEYGYVDSDKVEIQINDLRSMMGAGNRGYGADKSAPEIIPTNEDDEVIYDQTADEDIYEEV